MPEISEKMLIQQLREMEADGLVHREMFHEVPPRVEYSVTALGTSLNQALGPLADWGESACGADRHGPQVRTSANPARPRRPCGA